MLKKLFTPMKINGCEIPNRLVVTAMVANYCNEDGTVTDKYIKYHEEKAKGGWGLIVTEDYATSEHAKGYQFIAGLYNDEQIPGHKILTDTIHQYDSKIFCQIYHPGRQSTHFVNGGVQPIAPSAIPCPLLKELPHEMTKEEIQQVVKDFGDTALRAKKAGFDGVEVHAAHGYLLAEFLSTHANKRVDEYGGCFENRTRILREVMSDIRSKVGGDFPVIIRFSADEEVEGGRNIYESLELALLAEEIGFDALHVSVSVYGSPDKSIISSMYVEHGFAADFAAQIKKLVNIPVITVNRINDPKMADAILQLDKADFIGMGRGSLADPYLPAKAKAGDFESIRYCIGCLQGCMGQIIIGKPITCLVNPELGLEYGANYTPVATPKKIMVVGAGPGGLEVALIAAKRGHKVTVYERSSEIGGQFRSAAYPPCKGEFTTFTNWLGSELNKAGVEVKLDTEVTEDVVKSADPDSIILATGGSPIKPNIPGVDKKHVIFAEDILVGKVQPTNDVVICGGGEVGSETVALLAQGRNKVNVVEMLPDILMDSMHAYHIKRILNHYNVGIHVGAKVVEITDEGVVCENEKQRYTLPATTVVLAFGYKPHNPLEDIAKNLCGEVYTIGGAVKTSNAMAATREGYDIGMKL